MHATTASPRPRTATWSILSRALDWLFILITCAYTTPEYFRIRVGYNRIGWAVAFCVFTDFTSPTYAKGEVFFLGFSTYQSLTTLNKTSFKRILFIRVSATYFIIDFVYMFVKLTKLIQIIQAQDIREKTKIHDNICTTHPTSPHFFFNSKLLGPSNVKSKRVTRQAFEVWPLWYQQWRKDKQLHWR